MLAYAKYEIRSLYLQHVVEDLLRNSENSH